MRFIAYFDYLGLASVTKTIPIKELFRRVGHSSRDIEFAMALGKHSETSNPDGSVPADLSILKCHCVRFSDTIIFYSDDFDEGMINSPLAIDQLIDIVKVCYQFNNYSNQMYPIRGCLILGEMKYDYYHLPEKSKGNKYHYYRNAVFGKGLLNSYVLGELQNWAGAIVSEEIINLLVQNGHIDVVTKHFIRYKKVPFNETVQDTEDDSLYRKVEIEKEYHCFRLISKAPDEKSAKLWLTNYGDSIKTAFEYQQPLPLPKSVLKKLDNTLNFFKYCLEN